MSIMKKTILLISSCIIAAIIFSSCGTTGVSLTKRHYRSGYNLEISSAQTKTDSKAEKNNEAQTLNTTAETVNETTAETIYASIDATNENSYVKHKTFSFNQKEVVPVESGNMGNVSTKKERKKTSLLVAKASHIKGTINRAFKPALAEHDLGGLIWTLAGILLVLWLVSLLTGGWGLGGFLHIFLVVALILILLRLIHVI